MSVGHMFTALLVLALSALALGVFRAFGKKWRSAALLGFAAVLFAGLSVALLASHAAAIRQARELAEERPDAPRASIKEILERHFEMSHGGERTLVPKDPESDALEQEIAELGEDAVPQIREAMASLGPEYHDLLVGMLAWRVKEKADEAALEYLRELAASGQFRAVEFLGKASAADEDLQRLQAILEGGTDRRYAALRSLGETRRPEAVPILAPYLNDKDDAVRWNAANSLAKIGTEQAKRLLIARLPEEAPGRMNPYWAVLGGLMEMGHAPALQTHERELASVLAGEERDRHEVSHIVCAVSRIPDKSRQEAICLAMLEADVPYPSLKNGAVTTLGSIGPLRRETVRALLEVLCDESVEGAFRFIAARALNKGTSHHVELGTTCGKENLDRLCGEWRQLLAGQTRKGD
ncbi:MAG: HEAT repeat domain-containing protein [Planctomycetota bacterium]|jgi:hypothetical protein